MLPAPCFDVIAAGVLDTVLLEKSRWRVLGEECRHPPLQFLAAEVEEEFIAVSLEAVVADGEYVANTPPLVPLLLVRSIARNEAKIRRVRLKTGPLGRGSVVSSQPVILVLAQPPQVGVVNSGMRLVCSTWSGRLAARLGGGQRTVRPTFRFWRQLHKQRDRHPHGDVEHVVILGAVRRALLLLGRTMQVQHVNLIERLQQALPHPAVRQPVQIYVIRDEPDDARAGPFDAVMGPAQELDEVVVQVELLLVEPALVIVQKAEDILVAVLAAKVRVGRIAQHHQHWPVLLHRHRLIRLTTDD